MATPERKAETESNFASQLNACGDVAMLDKAGPIPFDRKEFKQ